MWGGLKGPLEGGMAIPIEKEMGPDWMTRGLSMGGGMAGMPPQPLGNRAIGRLAEDLSALQQELEGLDGEIHGLVDVLRPLLTNGPVEAVSPDLKIPPTDGRSQVSQVVLQQAMRLRELRKVVQSLGKALEL